jgi:hypothetical protein
MIVCVKCHAVGQSHHLVTVCPHCGGRIVPALPRFCPQCGAVRWLPADVTACPFGRAEHPHGELYPVTIHGKAVGA